MSESTATGTAAPAQAQYTRCARRAGSPCARGIWAILPCFDVRGFDTAQANPRKESAHA